MGQAPSLMDIARSVISLDAMQNRLPERLAAVIAKLRISQAEAARRCKISPSRLNNYLKYPVDGGRTPDIDTLMRIAQGLGTTSDYLLGLSEPEPPNIGVIVERLLQLEGTDPVRADAVAAAVQRALRILLALPDEGDAATRSRIAAQAAWQTLHEPEPPQ